ncbi:MAG: hypothetical protein GF398_13100 [Chitinivibrionales bacterium]|nr:hypothetical protein [Chitinivibrionales bacterium]
MLLLGTAFALFTGLLWGSVGVVFSKGAGKKYDYVGFMVTSQLINVIFGWILIPRYDILLSGKAPQLFQMSAALFLSGIFGAVGMMFMNKGMRMGHHASTWTIGQSALAIPFLAGVVAWRDSVHLWNVLGVAAILAGIALLGKSKEGRTTIATGKKETPWFFIALAALLILGIQQTLTTIPSRWPGWTDAARLRVPLAAAGSLSGYVFFSLLLRRYPDKNTIKYGAVLACVSLPGQLTFFKSLDYFAQASKAAIAYPVAVGTCIISFALYSALVIKEPLNRARVAGMVLGTAGIVFTALK